MIESGWIVVEMGRSWDGQRLVGMPVFCERLDVLYDAYWW